MKKRFLAIIFTLCILLNTSTAAFAITKNWQKLSQQERNDYIGKCFKDIKKVPALDDDTLYETFEIKTNRDPNYKEHRKGKTSLDGVEARVSHSNYMLPGYYHVGEKAPTRLVESGYILSTPDIQVECNKGGIIQHIITKKQLNQDIYVEKHYDKKQNLLYTKHFDNDRTVYFDSNDKFQKIDQDGGVYDIKGNKIKN